MTSPAIAAASAIFVWWLSTGAILLAVRWADRAGGAAHGMAVLAGTPLLAGGIAALILAPPAGSVAAVYAGFFAALAVWGWIELAFLAGILTGPERRACPPGLPIGARFRRAFGTVSHHEGALLAGLLAVALASEGAHHKIALWTYLILFGARISAKLNLFLGVPRINLEFVPSRLSHLKSYFRRGPVTPLFPLSVTLLTLAAGGLLARYLAASSPAEATAFALLATLAGLALLEHWLMVIPLPDAKLWRWMLPAPKPTSEGPLDGL